MSYLRANEPGVGRRIGVLAVLVAALAFAPAAAGDTLADPFTGQWKASIDSNSPPDGQVTFSIVSSSSGSAALQQMGGTQCQGSTVYYRGDYSLPASPGSSFVYTGSMYGCSGKDSQGHEQMDGRFKDPNHAGRFHIAVCVDVQPSENRFVGGWYFDTGVSKGFYGTFNGTRAGDCTTQGNGGGGSHLTFAGNWNTDFGVMHLSQSGNQVTGTYALCKGNATIKGQVHGAVLIGTWNQRCNSRHGKIRFALNSTGMSFAGTWGYGRAKPTSRWNGTRA